MLPAAIKGRARKESVKMRLGETWTKEIPEGKRGLSGSTIKLIAVITMIIDHTGAAILGRYLVQAGIMQIGMVNDQETAALWMEAHFGLYITYQIMRMIGRVAFPIYCFLLVEGFFKSRDRKKYCLRLFLFALLSEIPFNLALQSKILYSGHQNVFFELSAGLATIMAIHYAGERLSGRVLKFLTGMGIIIASYLAAEYTGLDYGGIGIVCIVLLYLTASGKKVQMITGALSFAWEFTAPLAFIPIGFYNGKRGLSLKYFFYIIYPAHLMVLYLLAVGLGIAGYPGI